MLQTHHDVKMRTTITLEKDVERMLRDAMHHSLDVLFQCYRGSHLGIMMLSSFAVKMPRWLRE